MSATLGEDGDVPYDGESASSEDWPFWDCVDTRCSIESPSHKHNYADESLCSYTCRSFQKRVEEQARDFHVLVHGVA